MPEAYIPLDVVAKYEGLDYHALLMRMQRSPNDYKTKEIPRESGRPRTLVSVSSLSSKARRLYRAERRAQTLQGDDLVIDSLEGKPLPWYVEADCHQYMERFPEQYEKAQEQAELMREFTDYCGSDRTGYARQFAGAHGWAERTLYRMSEAYLAGSAWALKYERETGRNHDYFKVLALCRKPKQTNTFPSLDPEVKALIENLWFDEISRVNDLKIQLLYDDLTKRCTEANVPFPSYPTVARYISYLMKEKGGHSPAYLAAKGKRAWENRYMVKGERDIKSLAVMELVMGDVHTFDFFVKFTPANGRPIAIRPELVAWMEVRSRRIIGHVMCRDSNAQIIKNCFAKMTRSHGNPQYLLIDNGKDFVNEDTLGYNRRERRLFSDEMKGFYKSMGVQDIFRSLPFQPWDKGELERFFGTVCERFSKWFNSYVGTLTGSRTDAKIKKDIDGMLHYEELFTMKEVYELWEHWLAEFYDVRVHRGLKDAGEEYLTPGGLFEHAEERYFKPAPPDSVTAMLMMKPKTARVNPTGIRHNKALYMSSDLLAHINSHVLLRYDPEDQSRIFTFTESGAYIGEIPLAEKLNAHPYADEAQVEAHKRKQNRHLQTQRDALEAYRTPFDQRPENADATPRIIGGVELTIGKPRNNNVLPMPREATGTDGRAEESAPAVNAGFYDRRGQAVLDRLNKLK